MSCRLPFAAIRRIDGVLLSFATLWSVDARALDVAECKALVDDAKRLACYDDALGRSAAVVSPATPATPSGPTGATPGVGLVVPVVPAQPPTATSTFDERWDLDGRPSPSLFALRPYKPIYILPAFYSSSPNLHPTSPNPLDDAQLPRPIDHVEGKFQISLKVKLLENCGGRRRQPVVRLHAGLVLAGLQRGAVAAVPRDRLRAGADVHRADPLFAVRRRRRGWSGCR